MYLLEYTRTILIAHVCIFYANSKNYELNPQTGIEWQHIHDSCSKSAFTILITHSIIERTIFLYSLPPLASWYIAYPISIVFDINAYKKPSLCVMQSSHTSVVLPFIKCGVAMNIENIKTLNKNKCA